MTGEVQQHINKFLFHLSQQDYAKAHETLEKTQKLKVDSLFNQEYEKIKKEGKFNK